MFHKNATAAVLAVLATLTVAAGVAQAAPPWDTGGSAMTREHHAVADGKSKGKEKRGKGKDSEPSAAERKAAAALGAALRECLIPSHDAVDPKPCDTALSVFVDLLLPKAEDDDRAAV